MSPRRATASEDSNLWQSFKRQSIQEAVIRLMCREGLKSVTMERVAQEVGIAKGTVYLHYRDKQQLLDAVKESSLAPLSAKIDDILSTPMSAERKLRAYALFYLTYFHEQRDLFRILLYEREVTRVQGSRYQADRYKRLVDGVTRVIREGIADGSFREVNAQHLAAMFVEANIAIVNQRLLTDRPAAVEDDAALIADVILRGIAIASRRSPK
jgi:AcrR family transcriptional regulator